MYTVYKHISPSNKIYIGITSQKPKDRWENGNGYKSNKYFYRAILLYGWDNFKHEIIAEGLTKEEAEKMEIQLIAFYDSTNEEKGYNLRKGGCLCSFNEITLQRMKISHLGKVLPEEQKKKISDAMKGRKVSKGMLGRKHSEETKRKMRNCRVGLNLSEETKKRISESKKGQNKGSKNHKAQSVINIDTGEQFTTITEAAEKYNLNHSNISMVCNGTRKTTGGFRWKYL